MICGPFFFYHVRARCRRASTGVLQPRKHSTEKHSAISPNKPQIKYVPIRVRQRKQTREHFLYFPPPIFFLFYPPADEKASTLYSRYLVYCSTASTAQHWALRNQPESRNASTCRSEIRVLKASKQSLREPAHVVQHLHSTLSSQNERRNQNVPSLLLILRININNAKIYNHSQRWCT